MDKILAEESENVDDPEPMEESEISEQSHETEEVKEGESTDAESTVDVEINTLEFSLIEKSNNLYSAVESSSEQSESSNKTTASQGSEESDNISQKTDGLCLNSDIGSQESAPPSQTDNAFEMSDEMVQKMDISVDIDNSVEKEPEKSKFREQFDEITPVISLDSDEEIPTKKSKRNSVANRCINYECQSGVNYRVAPVFCLSYYRVKMKNLKLQEVCCECYNSAVEHFEKLGNALLFNEYLIEQEYPMRNDLVEIIDSDEETDLTIHDKHAEYFEEEAEEFLSENFINVLNDTLNKFNIENQVTYATNHLKERVNKLKGEFDNVDDMMNCLQKNIDRVRTDLYAGFQKQSKELTAIDIIDVHDSSQTLSQLLAPICAIKSNSPPKIPKEAERRSIRNVHKPASYCESGETVEEVEIVPSTGPQSPSQNEPDVQVLSTTLEPEQLNLPMKGVFNRTRPKIGELYYAMKQSPFGAWGKVKLMDIITKEDNGNQTETTLYKVKFEGKTKHNIHRVISGKQLAYSVPSPVRLEVGTRVVAVFLDDTAPKRDNYFAGVVAEPMSVMNNFRYLVFFDDGYAQYVTHSKVLVVTECSKFVWEDIHPDSRLFIRKYLDSYPERPMVKLQPGQVVKTEWNGKWWIARVLKVEGSLVQMYFDADERSEWIYRGSTRLGPLFLEMQAATNRQEKGPHIPRMVNNKKNLPYVEYTRSFGDTGQETLSTGPSVSPVETTPPPRAVAKKSTSRTPISTIQSPPIRPAASNVIPFLPSQQIQQPQSKVVYFTPKCVVEPKDYVSHTCSTKCKDFITLPLSALKGYNPLSKPLLCGWYREMYKYKSKKIIRYRAPCGRSLRNMPELHLYLRMTKSDMSVDMFDFDFWVHCLAEFVLDKTFRSKKDISNGMESVPIPCVNYVDNTLPDFCNYSTKREPMEGVNLNLDEQYLCGCDCEDDCADKNKCQCWQLTIREARTLNKRIPIELIGYTYKRLPEFVTTGIYECNARCKCAATCLNRVVQHPLQLKLQLFKTVNRGWGIRCLNDIPQGAFICIYAGSLLTDKMANEGGVNYGDEYLAELDYIEVVEKQKDGYESDVEDIESQGTDKSKDEEDDEDTPIFQKKPKELEDHEFICSAQTNITDSPIRTRSKRLVSNDPDSLKTAEEPEKTDDKSKINKNDTEENTNDGSDTVTISDDEEVVRQPSRFDPSSETNMDESFALKFKSVRKMFGDDEVCYIMDAKNTGNIGRYLNHSCSPNVFVQNVFVDTHDLRFPWVAFFAMNYIRAGTELTWNYNYDVGSVFGKVIFCHCGSPECRGRLL